MDVPRLLCGAGIGNAESVVINCGKAGNDMSRILIIEDEVAIADLEKDYLELSDFQVSICNTGDEGLTEALNGNYDLVILDLPRRTILIRSEAWVWEPTII